MGPQLSTGSCRHHWLTEPAPSPPGRQATFPQPCLLKPNPSFQLQHERAPGPAFPGDPAACRSHGQGIFPAQCSKPAEPPEQRPGRDSDHLPSFTTPSSVWAGETQGTETILLGEACVLGAIPGGAGPKSVWSSLQFFQVSCPREETQVCWP